MGVALTPMPDPYGLQDYCHSLLPANPSNDDIYEALELFNVPKEAYPEATKQLVESWKVETPKEDLMRLPYKHIHVLLRRQVFVSVPSQIWPKHDVFQMDPAFWEIILQLLCQL